MLILSIETSNGKCSVALSLNDQILYSIYNSEHSKQAEYLLVMTQEVMQKASRQFNEIDYIAVSIGPGSFTGIRIGIAAAKGLGLALGKKVIGVNNFETLFYRMERQVLKVHNKLAVINAYRDELYICKKIGDEVGAPELVSRESLLRHCEEVADLRSNLLELGGMSSEVAWHSLTMTPEIASSSSTPRNDGGSSASRNEEAFVIAGSGAIVASGLHAEILPRFPIPDARFIALVAHEKILAGKWEEASPLYIRAPDAKLPTGKDSSYPTFRHHERAMPPRKDKESGVG
jgi:tRNA threonylcarbamoyladenosine biosynthesis protein TsaB